MLSATAKVQPARIQSESNSSFATAALAEFREMIQRRGCTTALLEKISRQPELATIKDPFGWTALHTALAHYDGCESSIIEALLSAGADPNAAIDTGQTALMCHARARPSAADKDNGATFQTLLRAQADPNAADRNGTTVLMYWAAEQHGEAIRQLLAAGADLHTVDSRGKTALMYAAASGNSRAIGILLENGADPRTVDKYGWTALMHAAEKKQRQAVEELQVRYVMQGLTLTDEERQDLRAKELPLLTVAQARARHRRQCALQADGGSQPTAADLRALQEAFENRNDAALAALIARKPALARITPEPFFQRSVLHDAVTRKCGSQVIEALLNAGADIDATAKSGDTPLMDALSGSNFDAVSALLHAGADTEVTNACGMTPLMSAASSPIRKLGAIRALLDAGANVEAADKNGKTALLHAASIYFTDGITALMHAGARLDAKDAEGKTALMWAATTDYGNTHLVPECCDVINALLRTGANLRAVDNKGQTALMWAAQTGNRYAAETLQVAYAVRRLAMTEAETRMLTEKQIKLLTPAQVQARIAAYQAWQTRHAAQPASTTTAATEIQERVQPLPVPPLEATDARTPLDNALARIKVLESDNARLRTIIETLSADKRSLTQQLADTAKQLGDLQSRATERETEWNQETTRWHADRSSLALRLQEQQRLRSTQMKVVTDERARLQTLLRSLTDSASQLQSAIVNLDTVGVDDPQ
ncbi:ankyrin repeat domain-containing protein [Cupriavidus gilardii]|uniref:ankyrin repeat domain-containing protein n=1 Tax=Cupriavidus gilardii TaxID=82541 RepID=UPI0015725BBF|nr:ankyrin repeat domain-containing protein [Cupriavidus gilardii]NSX02830.1 ankyrin repeat domain-containing protein [Cupriavidus gilardii]